MNSAVLDFLLMVGAALLILEIQARSGRVATWIIRMSVLMMPVQSRGTYMAEWQSIVADQPTDFSKLVTACGFLAVGIFQGILRRVHKRIVGEFHARIAERLVSALKGVEVDLLEVDIYELGFIRRVDFGGFTVDVEFYGGAFGDCDGCAFSRVMIEERIKLEMFRRGFVRVRFKESDVPWSMDKMSDEARLLLNFY